MTNRFKIFIISSLVLFFTIVPFAQSFFFSTTTKGSIKVNQDIKADFIQSDKKFILLFFGYFGCADVCTPIMNQISTLYDSKEFEEVREDVDFLFINITPEVEKFQPDLFAKYFNKNFHGVYLSKKELFNVDRSFGLYFARDLSDNTELNHTDYIYLIQNSDDKKVLKSIYMTHPFNTENLIDNIIEINNNTKEHKL